MVVRFISRRYLREDKRGALDCKLPPILERLQIAPRRWLYLSRHFGSRFKSLVGSACENLGKHWSHGFRDCELFLSPPPTPPCPSNKAPPVMPMQPSRA